jgi:hypothetical protein
MLFTATLTTTVTYGFRLELLRPMAALTIKQ